MSTMLPPDTSPTGSRPEKNTAVPSPLPAPDGVLTPASQPRTDSRGVVPVVSDVPGTVRRAIPKDDLPQADMDGSTGDKATSSEADASEAPRRDVLAAASDVPPGQRRATGKVPAKDEAAPTNTEPSPEEARRTAEMMALMRRQLGRPEIKDELVNFEDVELGSEATGETRPLTDIEESDVNRIKATLSRRGVVDADDLSPADFAVAIRDGHPHLILTTTNNVLMKGQRPAKVAISEPTKTAPVKATATTEVTTETTNETAATDLAATTSTASDTTRTVEKVTPSKATTPVKDGSTTTSGGETPETPAVDSAKTTLRRPLTKRELSVREQLDAGIKPIEIHNETGISLDDIYRINETRRRHAKAEGRELPDFRTEDAVPAERRGRTSASRRKILNALDSMTHEPDARELAEAAGVPLRTAQQFIEQRNAQTASPDTTPRRSPEAIDNARAVMESLNKNYFGMEQARTDARSTTGLSRSYVSKLESQLRAAKLTPDTEGGRLDPVHRAIAFDFLIAGMNHNEIQAKYAATEGVSAELFPSIISRLRGRGYPIPYQRRGPKPRSSSDE